MASIAVALPPHFLGSGASNLYQVPEAIGSCLKGSDLIEALQDPAFRPSGPSVHGEGGIIRGKKSPGFAPCLGRSGSQQIACEGSEGA